MKNIMNFTLSEQEKNQAQQAINTLVDILSPKLKGLSNQERIDMVKMGEQSISFVQKSLSYCKSDPQFCPAYLSVEEFDNDLVLHNQLQEIFRPINQLNRDIDDSLMIAGSESLMSALLYYNSVKLAAKNGIPQARPIYDDLKERFKVKRSSTENSEVK